MKIVLVNVKRPRGVVTVEGPDRVTVRQVQLVRAGRSREGTRRIAGGTRVTGHRVVSKLVPATIRIRPGERSGPLPETAKHLPDVKRQVQLGWIRIEEVK